MDKAQGFNSMSYSTHCTGTEQTYLMVAFRIIPTNHRVGSAPSMRHIVRIPQ